MFLGTLTVSSAASVKAVSPLPVILHRYLQPELAALGYRESVFVSLPLSVQSVQVFPSSPLTCHRYLSEVPEAFTVKVARSPSSTATSLGCWVICAPSTVSLPAPEMTGPAESGADTRQRYSRPRCFANAVKLIMYVWLPFSVQVVHVLPPSRLSCHWYDRSFPIALTLKEAFFPARTLVSAGCPMITGASAGSAIRSRESSCPQTLQ